MSKLLRVLLFCSAFFGITSVAQAAALFTQCPPTGVNTGCEFLITINANGTISVAQDPTPPNNGPYDQAEDTLVGIVNNSAQVVNSLPLSSNTDIYGFDGDGPCTQTPRPASCPTNGSAFGPTGYEGPNVTFSNINPAQT